MSSSKLVTRLGVFAIACVFVHTPSTQAASAPATQTVQFNVFLPLENSDSLDQLLSSLNTSGSSNYHRWLTPEAFREQFGPSPESIAAATAALALFGLTVTNTHSHGITVAGTVANVQKAFGVSLSNTVTPGGAQKLIANGPIQMPTALSKLGAQVVAFSAVGGHHTHGHLMGAAPANRYSPWGGYWFNDLKQAYTYPSYVALTGKGRTIGIVMSGDFLDSDMELYFGHENLRVPTIVRVPVDGGAPFLGFGSAETTLDIQQTGGMALGATIMLYNIPDLSDGSIIDAYLAIVENNSVDIVNSSFGLAEGFYTAAYNGGVDFTSILRLYNDIFRHGSAEGITFVASSGDNGGLGLPSVQYVLGEPGARFLPGIESPASDPNVTAVGGTNLMTSYDPPSLKSTYVSENADGDRLIPYDPNGLGNLVSGGYWGSGGGTSIIFNKPPYQYLVNTGASMRSIPDLSLQMGGCPAGILDGPCSSERSFVVVGLLGDFYGFIGTSISSPDFVGLLALEEEFLGGTRLGNVNWQVYDLAAAQISGQTQVYHQGIPGFNGYFTGTSSGYNMVVGNGTVIGINFISAFFLPPAENPQTPSNP